VTAAGRCYAGSTYSAICSVVMSGATRALPCACWRRGRDHHTSRWYRVLVGDPPGRLSTGQSDAIVVPSPPTPLFTTPRPTGRADEGVTVPWGIHLMGSSMCQVRWRPRCGPGRRQCPSAPALPGTRGQRRYRSGTPAWRARPPGCRGTAWRSRRRWRRHRTRGNAPDRRGPWGATNGSQHSQAPCGSPGPIQTCPASHANMFRRWEAPRSTHADRARRARRII
jgi:hypothetical protein